MSNPNKSYITETVLHYYRFNLEHYNDKQTYETLKVKLKSLGLNLFDYNCENPRKTTLWFDVHIKPLDNRKVELETDHLFINQWNTSKNSGNLRIFDWSEVIYPNKRIKEGYWLDQTEEMRQLRFNWTKCGYCGRSHHISEGFKFYPNCLNDFENIDRCYWETLRLRSICELNKKLPKLTDEELKTYFANGVKS